MSGSSADYGRVIHLAIRRDRQRQDVEIAKKRMAEEAAKVHNSIGTKFAAHYDAVENQIKSSTVGLVTLEEMKAKRETAVEAREKQLSHVRVEDFFESEEDIERERRRKKEMEKAKQKSCLSFDIDEDIDDEEEEEKKKEEEKKEKEEELEREGAAKSVTSSRQSSERELSASRSPPPPGPSAPGSSAPLLRELSASRSPPPGPSAPLMKKKKIGKDPTVDTSFLPDREREEEENKLREELGQKWKNEQNKIKNETINIAYSYWDGSGHRRDCRMKKGSTIHQFLQTTLESLRKEYAELKTVSADSLMFVKEDLIVPHFYTFYDFIVSKTMGKTGPLFEFDTAGELRIRMDASKDIGEAHPAKVCLRSWYEANKHIYPASHWEPFDPLKRYDKNYEDLKAL